MISEPPHINTDPTPLAERPLYSPAQEPLINIRTAKPGIQVGRPTWLDNMHLWNCQQRSLTDNARFGVQGFLVLILGLLQLLAQRWGRGAWMSLYLALLLAAPYYAHHWRCNHRAARFVRNLFFIVCTYPGDPNPPRLLPRTFPLVFIPISSLVLLFWP